MVTYALVRVGQSRSRKVSNRLAFPGTGMVLDVACKPDTSGHCERSESGSQVHQLAQGDTLEDSSWHFREFFFSRVILALLFRDAVD